MWNAEIAPAPFNFSQLQNVVKSEVSKMLSQQQGRRPQASSSEQNPPKRQRALLTKDDYCPTFNTTKSPPFCPNPTTPGGCMGADGKTRKHSCNAKLPGGKKFCNSSGHYYFTH